MRIVILCLVLPGSCLSECLVHLNVLFVMFSVVLGEIMDMKNKQKGLKLVKALPRKSRKTSENKFDILQIHQNQILAIKNIGEHYRS